MKTLIEEDKKMNRNQTIDRLFLCNLLISKLRDKNEKPTENYTMIRGYNDGLNMTIMMNSAILIEECLEQITKRVLIKLYNSVDDIQSKIYQKISKQSIIDNYSKVKTTGSYKFYKSVIDNFNNKDFAQLLKSINKQNLDNGLSHLFKYRNFLAHGFEIENKIDYELFDKNSEAVIEYSKSQEELLKYLENNKLLNRNNQEEGTNFFL